MHTKLFTFVVDTSYTFKNKLQEDVYLYCKNLDKQAFLAVNIERFKDLFIKKIEELNTKNKRCNPVKIDFWDKSQKDGSIINIHGIQSCSCRLILLNLVDL